jgi:hypothetical protein
VGEREPQDHSRQHGYLNVSEVLSFSRPKFHQVYCAQIAPLGHFSVLWAKWRFVNRMRITTSKKCYFTQLKLTGTLFDSLCSGEITLSCTHASTVLPGFPNFHLWLTALTPESESLRRCSGQDRPWESTHVYVTVAGRVVVILP